eukprot:g23079.t1
MSFGLLGEGARMLHCYFTGILTHIKSLLYAQTSTVSLELFCTVPDIFPRFSREGTSIHHFESKVLEVSLVGGAANVALPLPRPFNEDHEYQILPACSA